MKKPVKFLNEPRDNRVMIVNGTKYFIDWNDKTKTTQLFNWETEKIFKHKDRPPDCPCCKKSFQKDPDTKNNYWFDPCLGKLPGVKVACCGHGIENGYIWFESGKLIRFPKNVEIYQSNNSTDKQGNLRIREKNKTEK